MGGPSPWICFHRLIGCWGKVALNQCVKGVTSCVWEVWYHVSYLAIWPMHCAWHKLWWRVTQPRGYSSTQMWVVVEWYCLVCPLSSSILNKPVEMRANLQVLAERVRQYQQQMLTEEDAYMDVSSSASSLCPWDLAVQNILVCRSYTSLTSHKEIISLTLRFTSAYPKVYAFTVCS